MKFVVVKNLALTLYYVHIGQIAQLVEQRTENPCVASSILALANLFFSCHFQNTYNKFFKLQ